MPFSVHLPEPLIEQLDLVALRMNIRRNAVVRQAVERFVAQASVPDWPVAVQAHLADAQVIASKRAVVDVPELPRRRSPLKFRRVAAL